MYVVYRSITIIYWCTTVFPNTGQLALAPSLAEGGVHGLTISAASLVIGFIVVSFSSF